MLIAEYVTNCSIGRGDAVYTGVRWTLNPNVKVSGVMLWPFLCNPDFESSETDHVGWRYDLRLLAKIQGNAEGFFRK